MTTFRSTILSVILFACLGGGFVVHLRADEPSQSPAPAKRSFAESDLLELLSSTLQESSVGDRGELELRLTRPWATVNVPDEPLVLKVLDMPTAGVTPSFIIRFELCTTNETLGTWQTAVRAYVWREVWVAHTTLKRGQALADADVEQERRDVLTVREPLADFTAGDPTLELADSVRQGGILLARSLKPRPVIHRGQSADALVQDGALTVSMKVQALEDGAPGQIIRARNPVSRRDVTGKVLDEQTILISL